MGVLADASIIFAYMNQEQMATVQKISLAQIPETQNMHIRGILVPISYGGALRLAEANSTLYTNALRVQCLGEPKTSFIQSMSAPVLTFSAQSLYTHRPMLPWRPDYSMSCLNVTVRRVYYGPGFS